MHYIMVVGSGKSSRVNIESLLDDYLVSIPEEKTLILPIFGKPTEGQVFAAQFAKDQRIDIVAVATASDDLTTLPAVTVTETKNVLEEAFKPLDDQVMGVFILWNDDDEVSAQALAKAKDMGLSAHDLTNGLLPITPADNLSVQVPSPAPIPEVETDISDEDDEDEEMNEYDELIYAVETLAKFMAKIIIEEIGRV